MQLEEEKRSRAIREAELKAELELERQLREWEREQPRLPSQTVIADSRGDEASRMRDTNTPSLSQTRTQPIMATDYDVL